MKRNLDKSLYVVSSNDLIRAKYSYSLWEKRVFLYMISRLKREDKEFPMMKIPIRELMQFFGTTGKGEYQIIRNVPENIIKKPYYIPYAAADGERRWMLLSVISAGTQPHQSESREESYIELQFNPVLIPHLMELKEKFTKYNIRNISELQSVYSIRMFEFIKENEYRKDGFAVHLDELKEMLFMKAQDNDGVEMYPLYADFKKRVLLKAQEDLSKYCDTSFVFEERKEGRKVSSLYFKPLKTGQGGESSLSLPAPHESTRALSLPIQTIAEATERGNPFMLFTELLPQVLALGISAEVLQLLIETQPEEALRDGLTYTHRAMQMGKIRENPSGFFINAVKKRFTNAEMEAEKKQAQKRIERQARETHAQVLQNQADDLLDAYTLAANEIIRDLTATDPTVTERAIEAVKHDNWAFFKSKKINVTELTVADFRRDKILRGLVIQQIQSQNAGYFTDLDKQYLPKILDLEKEIKSLKT